MPNILRLEYEDPKTHVKSNGRVEIKNQTAGSADLYFYGDICSSTWDLWQEEDKCPQDVADFLNGLTGVKSVNVFINSGGGDSFAGLAIYNILKRNPATKIVSVDGLAASAASAIAMVGLLPGNQLKMPPGAQLMIHNAWCSATGYASDFRKVADWLDNVSQSYVDVYAEHATDGVTAEQIKQMMDAETWMTGTQAAEVFTGIQVDGEQIAASLDSAFVSRYKHVPKSLIRKPEVHDGVVPANISTDKAPEDQAWETLTLEDFTDKQWGDLTDQEKGDIAGHFAWAEEMPPDAFGSLKFAHHDPKTHKVVFRGIVAVAGRLDQADIPDADMPKVKDHIAAHYHDFGRKAPWEGDDEECQLAKARLALELEL